MQFIDLKKQQDRIRRKIETRIKAVLNHGKYIMGPEVLELEKKLALYAGTKYCVSCSSGTDALLIPLMAKNIGPGDAVITTPFTYIATAEVISLVGAVPVFVDIYPETYNINPDEIENIIQHVENKGLKPKAIIGVDLFGLPARYRLLEKIAADNGLFLIEDAAQGFGSKIRNRKAGSFGHVASTSFFPAKPLGATTAGKPPALTKSCLAFRGNVSSDSRMKKAIETFSVASMMTKSDSLDALTSFERSVLDLTTETTLMDCWKMRAPPISVSRFLIFRKLALSQKQSVLAGRPLNGSALRRTTLIGERE